MARAEIGWAIGATLALCATVFFVMTYVVWIPCQGSQTSEACLVAMDRQDHVLPTQLIWIAACVLCVWSIVHWSDGRAGLLPAVATGAVMAMNYPVEYTFWLAVTGDHWDVRPGTGYLQAAAIMFAAALVFIACVRTARSRPTESSQVAGARQAAT